MTVINGQQLLRARPIVDMETSKKRLHGVSYGLAEAGYDIRVKQDLYFGGNKRFVLASTIEEFDMPPFLVAVVHDKSTWARQGLSVLNTVIEPGWKGFLTMELVYHGDTPLIIKAGSGIAQVLFHEKFSNASYDGKYQNQEDRPVESIWELE